jgi:hypothetical protein
MIVVLLELKLDITLPQLDVKQNATVVRLKIKLNVKVGHWGHKTECHKGLLGSWK